MTQSTNRIGRIGEELAAGFLQRQGLRVLERNWRTNVADVRGELDIVAADGDVVVFCEVKSRRASTSEDALAGVHWRKQRQLRRLAALYLAGLPDHVEVRFDVVAVCWPPDGGAVDIVHVRNAF